ncbi:MAG: Type 1 glutamine amidotransferase-like domain-containing protein [Patescibacteria group bacterium]|nr:Type 1 glutamine amidotransferase-like domain-containing protein [Patescibacteria group bacterium]
MKLFLASEAKHPESIKKLEQFIGGSLKDKSIAYIPTAANGEFFGAWKGGESIKVAMSLGASVETVELENLVFENPVERLKDKDIIWVAGGMSGYLLYWIRRVRLDKVLPELLERGSLYVGSSAGSMICAKTQYSAEWYIGEPEPGCSLIPGLGLVDFEIYPHYEEAVLSEIEKRWTKGKLCLLKDGDVVTIDSGNVKVLGEEKFLEK